MSALPLKGKKIAVLVESQYIPGEIALYRSHFEGLGATVHLMADLWGNTSLDVISEFELEDQQAGKKPETLRVDIDFKKVKLEDYEAVLMSANYTSVRLRYFQAPRGPDGKSLPITPGMVRTSPAVQFFSRAMRDPRIVKGALCHALWLLTPTPELLAGRKVICHEVVLADILNAGGLYTPSSTGVVVDGDLVTGHSAKEKEQFAAAITDLLTQGVETRTPAAEPPLPPPGKKGAKRRILAVLSERGYWGEELVAPMEAFERMGYAVEFATPHGQRPTALPASMDAGYVEAGLGCPVTSPEMARKVRQLDETGTDRNERSLRLDQPLNLAALLPERPVASHPVLVRALEAYHRERERALRAFERFDALLLVGGGGALVDVVNNPRVHELVLSFVRRGKPIATQGEAVACLAFAREREDGCSLLRGKHVTGLGSEYEAPSGTRLVGTDFTLPPPYPLEYVLRDATAPEGQFHGGFGRETSVIVDFPFVTGRSSRDAHLTGQKLAEVLESGLRRWGF